MFFWLFLALLILSLSILLYIMVFRAFTFPFHSKKRIADRFIRQVKDDNSTVNYYCPNHESRGYVTRYMLVADTELKVKLLKCKVKSGIKYIKFRITAFDMSKNQINVMVAEEQVRQSGYTSAMVLPIETAFINLEVLKADDKVVSEDGTAFKFVSIIGFWLVSGFIITMAGVFISFCAIKMMGGLFVEGYLSSSYLLGGAIVLSSAAALLNVIISSIVILVVKKRSAS